MSPNVEAMRQYISDLYSGPRWKSKVQRMPDNQIIAIYFKAKAKEEEKEKESKANGEIPF